MALSAANRGSGGNNTAATSLTITPASNFTAGSFGILAVAYDNAGSQGADPFITISDTPVNTWTTRITSLNDPGAASAGSTLRIFTAPISTLTTANTITVSFGATSVTAKAWTLVEVSSNVIGAVISYVTGAQATGSGTTQTITTSSITINNLVFGVLGQEGNGTRTGDSDTTNGTWSTAQSAGFGTTTGGHETISQYKIVTATGAQTYNPTATALGDWCIGWISVTELIYDSFDPMGMNGFFGM